MFNSVISSPTLAVLGTWKVENMGNNSYRHMTLHFLVIVSILLYLNERSVFILSCVFIPSEKSLPERVWKSLLQRCKEANYTYYYRPYLQHVSVCSKVV
jgi:hypothetical protein